MRLYSQRFLKIENRFDTKFCFYQIIIQCNNKDGLHFGYWRDDVTKKPAFVAKNCGNMNCIFQSVAENVFGAVE